MTYPFPGSDDLSGFIAAMIGGKESGSRDSRTDHVIPTGFVGLDLCLGGGLRTGQLTLVGGVTGVGTSMFATDVARTTAFRGGLRTAVIAPDMSSREVMARVVSAETRVPLDHLRTGDLVGDDRRRIDSARQMIESGPLWINTGFGIETRTEVVLDTADYMTADPGAKVLIIDGTSQSEPSNRTLAIGLRVLAQERNLTVVVTSKSAPPRSRADQAPQLGDLREYESMADLFDLILGLHRDDLVNKNSTRPGEADVAILKHRHGPLRQVVLAFQGHNGRFVDFTS